MFFLSNLGEHLGLFCLIIQRSNLDGGTPKSRWGDAKSQWGGGTLTLDGGTRPPYNLSAECNPKVLELLELLPYLSIHFQQALIMVS